MSEWNCPGLSVEPIIFNERGELLLIQRGKEPFINKYALPGGRMEIGETAEENCARELMEECGIHINPSDLKLLGVYSNPERDPRRHNVSIAYIGFVTGQTPTETPEGKNPKFSSNFAGLEFAFDHGQIIQDAMVEFKKLNLSDSELFLKNKVA